MVQERLGEFPLAACLRLACRPSPSGALRRTQGVTMSKAKVVGGVGSAPTLEDVVEVAQGRPVALDPAAAERLKSESPKPSAFQPEEETLTVEETQSVECLTDAQARAVAFARLLSLANGKTRIRPRVVSQLVDLLSQPGILCLPSGAPGGSPASDAHILRALTAAVTASGNGGETLVLGAGERAVLESGQAVAVGVGALAVEYARGMQLAALAVAALSCEALQAEVKAFEADKVEAECSKQAAGVASTLRDLLEDSSRVNIRKGGAGPLPCILKVPKVHGAMDTAVSQAAAAVRSELRAAPQSPESTSQLGASLELGDSLLSAASALMRAAELSAQRVEALRGKLASERQKNGSDLMKERERMKRLRAEGLEALEASENSVPVALYASAAGTFLQRSLAEEAAAALQVLREQGVPLKGEDAGATDVAAGGKKDKKKRKDAGASTGKGTSAFQRYLEEASTSESADGSAVALVALSLDDAQNGQISHLQALGAALDPFGRQLPVHLTSLRRTIESNAKTRKPKVAKGARDFLPDQMAIRAVAFAKITRVLARHGAVAIDTPVFELRETLTGKYGEDSKLIYDLADQGGEILSLRYDLTVPFARYVALNGITSIKRYHIGKVYRRDQPQMARGRYREFFQCDFDIAGACPLMVADAEVLKVVKELLEELALGAFTVKLNHRRLLDGMMSLCGVPKEKFRPICSAIDKLDKEDWATVRAEMVDIKGLHPEAADKIGTFVGSKGAPKTLLAELSQPDHPFMQNSECSSALKELAVLFDLLEAMGGLQNFSFDLSLARGLDYYTGLIYEAVLEGTNVGSVAAGGRYDGLVGMFSNKPVPAVGVSLGIERIFAILEAQTRQQAKESGGNIRETATQVMVMSASKDMQAERIRLCTELWAQNIAAEFGYKANPFMPDQMSYATAAGIPFAVVLRPDELKQGQVELMEMTIGHKENLKRSEVVAFLVSKLEKLGPLPLVAGGHKKADDGSI